MVDKFGDLFVVDICHRVHMITSDTKTIVNIAGTGSSGFSGDGGPATPAELNSPQGIAFDAEDNVYIADGHNNDSRSQREDGRRGAAGH